MATMPAFLRKNPVPASATAARRPAAVRLEPDPFQLRALPLEDVFFHCKKIDNSRLVREPDPEARGACWSTIVAACLLVGTVGTVLAPSVGATLAGYRLEALKQEEQRLLNERRVLELEEARLLSPARLEELARKQQMVTPSPGQVVHLDGKDGAVAMMKEQ
jgi:cell division protein FtsL